MSHFSHFLGMMQNGSGILGSRGEGSCLLEKNMVECLKLAMDEKGVACIHWHFRVVDL